MLLGILLTLLIIDCVALTGVILLQRSEGGALGMGGGGGGFMTARGAADFLTRTTQVLATIFFVLSLAITILAGRTAGVGSIVDKVDIKSVDPSALAKKAAEQAPPAPAFGAGQAAPAFTVPAPSATDAPLGGFGAPAPAAPATGGLTVPPPTTR